MQSDAASGAAAVQLVLPDPLRALIRDAHGRLRARMVGLAPALGPRLVAWMEERAPRGLPPEHYFTHPLAFPLLLLPWWLEESLSPDHDAALQGDLIYSSMCGYYVVRLIDDVMDRGDPGALALLPGACLLHTEFQLPYASRIGAADPFWTSFCEAWAGGHEASAVDAGLAEIDRATFERVSARKVSAARIPMLAVAASHGLRALPEVWERLFAELCPFHQLYNDLFDWQSDLAAGSVTWFLSEGERARRREESMAGWVAREGFELGLAWLEERLDALDALATEAGSAGALAWIAHRRDLLGRTAADARAGLAALRALLAIGATSAPAGAP